MRDWLVGGAIVVGPDGLLLVRNRRRNGAHDWSPPGGVIDEGEGLIDGLTREVQEETGLRVTRWAGPLYCIDAVAPGLGWTLRVEAHLAVDYEGELTVADPDGIVVDARFVPFESCEAHLVPTHPWVREPLVEWLAERWHDRRDYGYRVEGARPDELVVSRV